jgi:predicted transcriptional regulator
MEVNELVEAASEDEYLRDLFFALSNRDSLRIFRFASEGIPASKSALEQYQFSKKRYYPRLKQLIGLGLISKQEGTYKHTPLGAIIYENQIRTLSQLLVKSNTLQLLNNLKQKNKPSESLNAVISDLSRKVLTDLESTVGLSNFKPIRLFKTMEDYDSYVVAKASRARSQVYFASRNAGPRMADALLRIAQRGRQVDAIFDFGRGLQKKMVDVPASGSIARREFLIAVQQLQTNPSASIMKGKIPFGFLVTDNLEIAIEIANPEDPQSFLIGLGLQNEALASRLISFYEELSKSSDELPLISKIDLDENASS